MKTTNLITFIACIISVLSPVSSFAGDTMGSEFKKLELRKGSQKPPKFPKAPEYVPVTCYYDGEALTFVSSYDTEAEIIVTDSFTSAVFAHETAQLAPEYTVSIAGAESFDITLTLEDGSILYGSY